MRRGCLQLDLTQNPSEVKPDFDHPHKALPEVSNSQTEGCFRPVYKRALLPLVGTTQSFLAPLPVYEKSWKGRASYVA